MTIEQYNSLNLQAGEQEVKVILTVNGYLSIADLSIVFISNLQHASKDRTSRFPTERS